jgi:hypothetical protein
MFGDDFLIELGQQDILSTALITKVLCSIGKN